MDEDKDILFELVENYKQKHSVKNINLNSFIK